MCEKGGFIREQITLLENERISCLQFIKTVTFKILPKSQHILKRKLRRCWDDEEQQTKQTTKQIFGRLSQPTSMWCLPRVVLMGCATDSTKTNSSALKYSGYQSLAQLNYPVIKIGLYSHSFLSTGLISPAPKLTMILCFLNFEVKQFYPPNKIILCVVYLLLYQSAVRRDPATAHFQRQTAVQARRK